RLCELAIFAWEYGVVVGTPSAPGPLDPYLSLTLALHADSRGEGLWCSVSGLLADFHTRRATCDARSEFGALCFKPHLQPTYSQSTSSIHDRKGQEYLRESS